MRCFYHPDRDAVAQCVDCGRGLCHECASKWNPPTCDGCGVSYAEIAKKRLALIRGFGIAGIICGIIGCVITLVVSSDSSSFNPLVVVFAILMMPLFAYEYAAIPVGWAKLNKITSRMFLFLPILGWVIYFTIKFTLSGIVGIFTLPKEYIRLKRIVKDNS